MIDHIHLTPLWPLEECEQSANESKRADMISYGSVRSISPTVVPPGVQIGHIQIHPRYTRYIKNTMRRRDGRHLGAGPGRAAPPTLSILCTSCIYLDISNLSGREIIVKHLDKRINRALPCKQ